MNTYIITYNFLDIPESIIDFDRQFNDFLIEQNYFDLTPRPDLLSSSGFTRYEITGSEFHISFLAEFENSDDAQKKASVFTSRIRTLFIQQAPEEPQAVCRVQITPFNHLELDVVYQETPGDRLYAVYSMGAVYELLDCRLHLSELRDPNSQVFDFDSNRMRKLSVEEAEPIKQSNFYDPNITPQTRLFNSIWKANGDAGGHRPFSKGAVFVYTNSSENKPSSSPLSLFISTDNLGDSFSYVQINEGEYELKGRVPANLRKWVYPPELPREYEGPYEIWGILEDKIFKSVDITEITDMSSNHESGYDIVAIVHF